MSVLRTGILYLVLFLFPTIASAVTQAISYQGRILKPDGNPLDGNSVNFTLRIMVANTSCSVYSETHNNIDMSKSDGVFNLLIGKGTKTNPSGLSVKDVFSPTLSLPANTSGCTAGYTRAPSDTLQLQVSFNDGTGEQNLQGIDFTTNPMAFDTVNVGGVPSTNVLRFTDATPAPLPSDKWTELLALLNGTSSQYLKGGNGPLALTAGGNNENVTITPSGTGATIIAGNVGIGTTAPTTQLMVKNDNADMTSTRIENSTSAGHSILELKNDVSRGYIGMFGSTSTAHASRFQNRLAIGADSNSSGISFRTDASNYIFYNKGISSGGYEVMRLERYSGEGEARLGLGVGYNAAYSPNYYTYLPPYSLTIGAYSTVLEKKIGVERQVHPTILGGHHLGIYAGGAALNGTNTAGGDLNLVSGVSTGTASSSINFKTSSPSTSGSADNPQTTKMTIQGNGYVGIGTTIPQTALHVVNSGNGTIFTERNDLNDAARPTLVMVRSRPDTTPPSAGFGTQLVTLLEGFTNDSKVYTNSINNFWENNQTDDTTSRNSAMTFTTASAGNSLERMRISSQGNVSVNSVTTNISGSHSSSRVLTIAGDGTYFNSDGRIELVNPRPAASIALGDAAGRMYFVMQNNNALNTIASIITTVDGSGGASGFGGKLHFQTKDDNSTNISSKMVIDQSGKVGIGTTAPTQALEVSGTVKATAFVGSGSGLTGVGAQTLITFKCPWHNNSAGYNSFSSCTPPSCPTGWTDLGVNTEVIANNTISVNFGNSYRTCYQSTGYAVFQIKCPWHNSSAGYSIFSSCTPPSCPTGWTDLGTSTDVVGSNNSSVVFGNTSRFCTK